ncbi:MAG: FKBP-type peptidyl-prolyl cis-trans isomerase [Candidatus Hydrogenedentes bacterium]|nr:FKBP-type peptidyl-prolyl cis-trans isomerase [Candidatus Hydrogenedentota bacterium]
MKRNLVTFGIAVLLVAVVVYINRLEPRRAAERKVLNEARIALQRSAPPQGETLDGAQFLKKNARREEVTVLPSGLQYEVLVEGQGRRLGRASQARIEYRGSFRNGNEFINSYSDDEPNIVNVGGTLPGWQEALSLMKEGSKWLLHLPPNLAFAENGNYPDIPPNTMLTFEMELIEVVEDSVTAEIPEPAISIDGMNRAYLDAHAREEGVVVLSSGLQYRIIRPGTGPTPGLTDRVRAHYIGSLINGVEFDSSYRSNKPVNFDVTEVIPGWTEALQLMKVGARWELVIPPELAYGAAGSPPRVPPNSVLRFDIELLAIR